MQKSFSEKYNGKKVSDIFKEYANPFLEMYLQGTGSFNTDDLKQILMLPWLVWNSLIINKDKKNKVDFSASIDLLIRNNPEAKLIIEMMRERKKSLFKEYDFLFGDYKLTFDNNTNELKIWMEAKTVS